MSVSYNSNSRQQSFTSGGIPFPIPGVKSPLIGMGGLLGGGIRGIMPQATIYVDKTYVNYEQIRVSLKHAWNNLYNGKVQGSSSGACTPFRAVTNSGDILSRKDYSCGGTCQTFQSRPNLRGLRNHFGAINSSACDGSGLQPASCNVKYVYDSSDYIRYRKQLAVNKNYNDVSNGGDMFKASQSAVRNARRF